MPVIQRGLQFWKCAEELLLDYLNERCGSRANLTYIPSGDETPVLVASWRAVSRGRICTGGTSG